MANENLVPESIDVEPEYITYLHHGKKVVVRKDLMGLHREHCLCYDCLHFDCEGPREENCAISNAVYDNCVLYGIVTPIWECPDFAEEIIGDDDDESDIDDDE